MSIRPVIAESGQVSHTMERTIVDASAQPKAHRLVMYGLDGSIRTSELTPRVPAVYAVGETIAGLYEGDRSPRARGRFACSDLRADADLVVSRATPVL